MTNQTTSDDSRSPILSLHKHRRSILILLFFVAVYIAARLLIHPINVLDYYTTTRGVNAFLQGQSPYTVIGYFMPPWSVIFLAPLANQPIETWLALDIAIFAAMILDLGKPSGLLLLLHPAFLTLLASSNQEWLLIGPGLWLLYRAPRGWLRGLAWLLLTCKPQAVIVLLIFDGWDALRTRDWRAIGLAAVVAIVGVAVYPEILQRLLVPLDWSLSVVSSYGLIGAAIATVIIVGLRRNKLADRKTLGLLLSPVWTPYMLQYSYCAVAFTLRGAGIVRTVAYVIASLALAVIYWQHYHVAEQIGALGMVLLAALLAPAYLSSGHNRQQRDSA
jgi:hypothetical protein